MASGNGAFEGTASGNLRGRVYYEYTQNVSSVTTTVTYYVQASKTSSSTSASSGSKVPAKLVAKDVSYEATVSRSPEFSIDKDHWETIYTITKTYSHNSDGTLSAISVSGYVKGPTASSLASNQVNFSGSISIPSIQVGPNITSLNLAQDTETTLKYHWASSDTIDKIKLQIKNPSTGAVITDWYEVSVTAATSGVATISGLNPNTNYRVLIMLRKKSNSKWSDLVGGMNQTTYPYPTITSLSKPSLTIGETQTVTINNPLSRSVTLTAKIGSTSLGSVTGTGTSLNLTPSADTIYTTLKRELKGDVTYTLTYSGQTSTKTGTITNIPVSVSQNEWGRETATANTIKKFTLKGYFLQKIGSTNNKLTIQYKYQVEGASESSYTTICSAITASNSNVTIANNMFEVTKAISISCNYQKSCTITVKVTDSKTSQEYTLVVSRGVPPWWTTDEYLGVRDKIYINGIIIEVVDE